MGQGALDGVPDLPALARRAGLPDRARALDERARPGPGAAQRAGVRPYVRQTAGTGTSTADELSKLADLRDRGTISDEEFQHAKAKLLGRQPEAASRYMRTGTRSP